MRSLCATLLACQFLLGLLGLGHHDFGVHDFHDEAAITRGAHDASTSWLVGVLTFRTVVAALTFFGLAGRAAPPPGFPPVQSFGLARAGGAGAIALVASLCGRYAPSGPTGPPASSAPRPHRHRLPVDPRPQGRRRQDHLVLQNRTMEYQAVTAGDELPTGADSGDSPSSIPTPSRSSPHTIPERTCNSCSNVPGSA